MEEVIFTEELIKKRVTSGFIILGLRRILVLLIFAFSNIILARILTPEIFGAFAIISFLILTLGMVTTFGLGAALIQKSGQIKKRELQTIFTLIISASFIFVLLLYLVAPLINFFYKNALGAQGVFWLRLFLLTLILINANVISSAILERKLDYKKITLGEIFTLILIQALAIIFALKGFGVGSFVLGNLLGRFVGLLLFFYLAPWSVGFNFSMVNLKKFLPFGLNFQANHLIDTINTAVIPVFVGSVSGAGAVGLVGWAGGLRQAGLAPSDVVWRLIFPACSRAQENKKLLKSLIEKLIQVACMLSFPLLAVIFALAPSITYIIYTSKWLPGLTALYLSLIQGVFLILGLTLIQVLFALGEAKTARNISLFWAILQWVLTVPLVLLWNFNGVVLAGILVSTTFFVPLREVRKKVEIDIWPHVLPYLFYSILAGLSMFTLSKIFTVISVWQILFIGLSGGIVYGGLLLFLKKEEIKKDWMTFRELIFQD